MNDIAEPGHNLRSPLDVEIETAMREYREQFDARAGEIERCNVSNLDEAGRATALGGILADIAHNADKKRAEIKKPYLDGGRQIDTQFGTLIKPVEVAKERIIRMIHRYRDEQERKVHEEALRIAKEAAEKEAAAKAAADEGNLVQAARLQKQANAMVDDAIEISNLAQQPIRSDYGQAAFGRTEWYGEIIDRKKLPASVTQHPKVVEALDTVVRAMVRGGAREIPGVRIWSQEKTAIRR